MNTRTLWWVALIAVNGLTLPLLYEMVTTPTDTGLMTAFVYGMTLLVWIVMNVTIFHVWIAMYSKDESMIRYGFGFIVVQLASLLFMVVVNPENFIANIVLGGVLVVAAIALLTTIARNR